MSMTLHARPAAAHRRTGASTGTHVPLIERYHERLPFEAGDKLVSLQEGSTPLLRAPVLSEMVGATVRLKLEGANPTGSFKDRGMTCAVSAAVRDGAQGRDLRLDGQHRGERGGVRGARGHHLRGDRAGGQDRAGQDGADARARRARDLACRATSTRR